jgi:XTP/dITP diphosphohydrolase
VSRPFLVATRNPGKQREIEAILQDVARRIVFPDDVGLMERLEEARVEVEDTFEGNALRKAEYFARRSGLPTAADDSGLEVFVLGGLPGVRSRRFAMAGGSPADEDAANNAELLRRLAGLPEAIAASSPTCRNRVALPSPFRGPAPDAFSTRPAGPAGSATTRSSGPMTWGCLLARQHRGTNTL